MLFVKIVWLSELKNVNPKYIIKRIYGKKPILEDVKNGTGTEKKILYLRAILNEI